MEPDQQSYERARARVQALKGFYIHASAFILVNIGLFVINVLTGGVWWFYWPLLGWESGSGYTPWPCSDLAGVDRGAGTVRNARCER